jgi:hypothetical protein
MAGVSDEAFDQYFGSKGQRADIALQEDGRPVHSERADPTRQLGPEYSPGELQALKTGDASLYIAEQHAASPGANRAGL